jgi:alkaline phosphatase D
MKISAGVYMDRFDFEQLLLSKVKRRRLLLGAGALTGLALASQWPKRAIA